MISAGEVAAAGSIRDSIGRGPVGLRFAPARERGTETAPLIALASTGDPRGTIEKEIAPGRDEGEFEVRFVGLPAETWLVSEWNLSLLTADAPGRRLLLEGKAQAACAPGSTGEADSVTSMRLEDSEYLQVALTLEFEPAARVEWSPVETVSLSEAGAERVYQGTAFLIGFRSGPERGSAPIRIAARVGEVGAGR
jgi:hypothetical protein